MKSLLAIAMSTLVLGLVVSLISSSLFTVVSILMWLVMMVVGLGYLGGLIFCAVKAYGGNTFKLPLIGNTAEKVVNK